MRRSDEQPGTWWSDDGADSATIRVAARPGARRSEVWGVAGDELVVRIAAPPVEGAANAELERFLAKALGVRPAAVSVERGATSRHKVVSIRGVAAPRVVACLTPPGTAGS